MFAPGEKLFQVVGENSAGTVYSASMHLELTKLVICNTTAVASSYCLYHNSVSSNYSQGLALFFNRTIAAYSTQIVDSEYPGNGFMLNPGDRVGFSSSSPATLTVYAVSRASR